MSRHVGRRATRQLTLTADEWHFTAPVVVGDTNEAEGEIVEVHPHKPVTRLRVRVTRQDGETVLHGHAWCHTFRPTPAGVTAG